MYLDPAPISPFAVTWLGFFAIGIGILLMVEAARASARGAPQSRVEREGSMGAWAILAGIALVVIGGALAVLS